MLLRTALSALLGVVVLLSAAAPTFAETTSMTPQEQAADAIKGFCADTALHWSEWGFESAAGARGALGNNQSDWFTQTLKLAGLNGCPSTR